MMQGFRCLPIPTATAIRFRTTGQDDRGNPLRELQADNGTGYPCRHCLQLGQAGDRMLLGSYDLSGPQGIYWTASPIFVHARACPAYAATNDIPPTLKANSLVSVRAYDLDDQCLYDLGQVCAGADLHGPLLRALGDPRTAFVNIHTARPGCFLARIERA